MGRQLFSWTSAFGRRAGGSFGAPRDPWEGLPFRRRSRRDGMLRSGWFWTAVVLAALLVGAASLLSVFGSAPVSVPGPSTPLPAGETSVVPAYDPQLGLAGETPWGQLILDMVLKLVLVAALIVGVLWLLKFARSRLGALSPARNPSSSFTVLESGELGPGHSVYTLDLGRRVLVVGATSAAVSLLTEITNPDEIEYLRRRSGSPSMEFDRVLAETHEAAAPLPFQEVAERLKHLAEGSAEHRTEAGSRAVTPSG